MRFLDSHAHLAAPEFESDLDDVIARARQAGAVAIVCIGETRRAAERAGAISRSHPGFVHYTAGVHPHEASEYDPARDPDAIRAEVERGAVAIGECGLDYHYDHAPRALQRSVFSAQVALGAELECPVVVHTRDAEDDTVAIVREAGDSGVRGVLHCFTGSPRLADAAIDAGWYISFSGIVTFRNWHDEALLRLVPGDLLLAESDSPYLAPVPHRGSRNEPAWVALTVERLAAARGTDAALLGEAMTANARRFFGLPEDSQS